MSCYYQPKPNSDKSDTNTQRQRLGPVSHRLTALITGNNLFLSMNRFIFITGIKEETLLNGLHTRPRWAPLGRKRDILLNTPRDIRGSVQSQKQSREQCQQQRSRASIKGSMPWTAQSCSHNASESLFHFHRSKSFQ